MLAGAGTGEDTLVIRPVWSAAAMLSMSAVPPLSSSRIDA